MRSAIALASWIVLLLVWMAALQEWPTLPAKFPTHFDFAGKPDSYSEKSMAMWFLLPVFATALHAGLTFLLPMMRWLSRNHPEFVNMPHKSRWLKLDADARCRTLEPARGAILLLRLNVVSLLLFIVIGSAKVASGSWSVLPAWPLAAFLGATGACVAWLLWRSFGEVRKETANFRDPP